MNALSQKIKHLCADQLWLIALMVPLLGLTALALTSWSDSGNDSRARESEHSMQGISSNFSVEISSAEVAIIVAKPLKDLLKMEVYFDRLAEQSDAIDLAKLDANHVFGNGISNKMLVFARRDELSVITYSEHFNNNKIEKIVKKT